MFVGAIREGLSQGFKEAVNSTVQDSSNAAVHWMVGVTGRSESSGRKLGKKENIDLRNTKERGQLHPLIGFRGDNRDGTSVALAVQKDVLDREIRTIINKYAAGQKPETKFYLYNTIGGSTVSEGNSPSYAESANIQQAGEAGVTRIREVFSREIQLGNVRRNRLK